MMMIFSLLHWKWALKNLTRNPRRSLVTGLAISSGFIGLMLFTGYVYSIEKSLATLGFMKLGVGHVNIYKKDGVEKSFINPKKYSLTIAEQKNISTFLEKYKSDIVFDAGSMSGVGLIGNGCRSVPFLIFGISQATQKFIYNYPPFKIWGPQIKPVIEGMDFSVLPENSNPIIITKNLSQLLNKKKLYIENSPAVTPWVPTDCDSQETKNNIENDTSLQLLAKGFDGEISAIEAQVSGFFIYGAIYAEDMAINAPLKLVQKIYNTDQVSKWLVYISDQASLSFWKSTVRKDFEKNFPHLEMLFYDEARANPFYAGVKEFLGGMSSFFIIVIGIVIALAISNSTTMNLLDRAHEIGTLRSLGLTSTQINILISQESFLLSILSLSFGIVASFILALLINEANIRFDPPGSSGSIQLRVFPQINMALNLSLLMTILISIVTYYLVRKTTSKKITNLLTQT